MSFKLILFLVLFNLFQFLHPCYSDGPVIIPVAPIPYGGNFTILSSDLGYPSPEIDIDYLWKFSEDIEIEVQSLELDGQEGDFFIFSPYPFNYEDATSDNLIKRIPKTELILLTWKLPNEPKKIIRLVNLQGVFIYFHANLSFNMKKKGFSLKITPFGKEEEKTTTTETPELTPPPLPADYVQKFITGKLPLDFVKELDTFKETVANITNVYLERNDLVPDNETIGSDVKMSMDEIKFCDKSWSAYNKCVEINFAISTYASSVYLMTPSRINEMWASDYCISSLKSNGYIPYEPPFDEREPVGVFWIATYLGAILLFSTLLCWAWLKKANSQFKRNNETIFYKSVPESSREKDEGGEEETFYDRKNPQHYIRKTMVKNQKTTDVYGNDLMMTDFWGNLGKNFSPSYKNAAYDESEEEHYNRKQ